MIKILKKTLTHRKTKIEMQIEARKKTTKSLKKHIYSISLITLNPETS